MCYSNCRLPPADGSRMHGQLQRPTRASGHTKTHPLMKVASLCEHCSMLPGQHAARSFTSLSLRWYLRSCIWRHHVQPRREVGCCRGGGIICVAPNSRDVECECGHEVSNFFLLMELSNSQTSPDCDISRPNFACEIRLTPARQEATGSLIVNVTMWIVGLVKHIPMLFACPIDEERSVQGAAGCRRRQLHDSQRSPCSKRRWCFW